MIISHTLFYSEESLDRNIFRDDIYKELLNLCLEDVPGLKKIDKIEFIEYKGENFSGVKGVFFEAVIPLKAYI